MKKGNHLSLRLEEPLYQFIKDEAKQVQESWSETARIMLKEAKWLRIANRKKEGGSDDSTGKD